MNTNIMVTINERKSEMGQDRNTPLRPKKIGRIKIAGSRKITCLEKLMIRAGTGFPIAWKSVPPTIKNPSIGRNMTIILIGTMPLLMICVLSVNILKRNSLMQQKSIRSM